MFQAWLYGMVGGFAGGLWIDVWRGLRRKKPAPMPKCQKCGDPFLFDKNGTVCLTCPPVREWWMAVGHATGKVFEIVEGGGTEGPPLLPPCTNQDLPVWTKVREVMIQRPIAYGEQAGGSSSP